MQSPRYISLFSGGFGLDLGLQAEGLELVACLEISQTMRETIRRNRPFVRIIGEGKNDANGDLFAIPTSHILKEAGLSQGEVDLVVGGPPCQSFSILGKRQGLKDVRGHLIIEFVRVVRDIRPKGFLLENVTGFIFAERGALYKLVLKEFVEAGYRIFARILNAVDFGVPQYRKRIFLFGVRSDMPNIPFLWPYPTHRPRSPWPELFNDLPTYRIVRDVLYDIPSEIPNHYIHLPGWEVRKRYEKLIPGVRDFVNHMDRLHWDRPSGTVLAGSSRGGGRSFIHPQEPRQITVREAARLQTFPDDWVFYGSEKDQYLQVGNAVPVLLAQAIARSIATYFHRQNIETSMQQLSLVS